MARPVEEDARGIVAPDRGLQNFRLDRFDPSPEVARFVAWYWVVSWDLQEPHEQPVFSHPVVNVVLGDGPPTAYGPPTCIGSRVLEGRGRALGVLFRPAGFRPLLDGPMTAMVDQAVPFDADVAAEVEAVDALLAVRLPAERQPSEATTVIAERIAADPGVVRVAALAAELGISERQLQRRFADHVGLSPKAIVRRYRLYEAAERARAGEVDWAALAAELGYSDQSHLTRDFTAALGTPPARYSAMAKVSSTKASTMASSRQAS
ncbi:MAG: Helix-turn-helix, AraC domain protein [Acidimicrobiales bacterium]|nr:Helix-turn-helix, AraC domain protein [Acidimicrobiales bacterium]